MTVTSPKAICSGCRCMCSVLRSAVRDRMRRAWTRGRARTTPGLSYPSQGVAGISGAPDTGAMNGPGPLGTFLQARRARLRPQDVGLRDLGPRRRVAGLRREELAQLAGVSVSYYTR